MAKDEAPPPFLKPGDDPEVDALLARLQKDGEDGDPLYVNFRKRRRERTRGESTASVQGVAASGAPAAANDASDVASPSPPEAASSPTPAAERPVEPQPVELPASPPQREEMLAEPSRSRPRATPRWLLWAALAITAPVVAIVIGFAWSHHPATEAPGTTASARVHVTAAPPASAATSAPAVDPTAVPAPATSATVAPLSTTARALPVKPHGKRVPVPDDPYTDAAAPTAATVTAVPSVAPAPPPVRMQPEDSREF